MKSQGFSLLPASLPEKIFAANKKVWIIVGVVLWLYFVIAHIPAVWGAYLLTRTGAVGMTGVSGTIWSGSASLASVKVKQADYSLGQLSWTLNGFSFLLLKPCAKIETSMDNQRFNGNVCVGINGSLSLANTDVSFPARLIQPQLPLPIDGKFTAHVDSLTVKNNQVNDLQGKLSWAEAKVHNGTNWMELGGFGAELTDDDNGGISAHIFDVNSPVHVDLKAGLQPSAATNIKGMVSMSEAFAQQANANAWITMFATPTTPDSQGNLQYALDLTL